MFGHMVGLSFTLRKPHEHHRVPLALELFDLAAIIALEAGATGLLRGKGRVRATTRQRGAHT